MNTNVRDFLVQTTITAFEIVVLVSFLCELPFFFDWMAS